MHFHPMAAVFGFFTTLIIVGYGFIVTQIDAKIPKTNTNNIFFKLIWAFLASVVIDLLAIFTSH